MKVQKSTYSALIAFEHEDWRDGLARAAMEVIKKHKGKYLFKTKQWWIPLEKPIIMELKQVYELYRKNRVELDDYSEEDLAKEYPDLFPLTHATNADDEAQEQKDL